MTLATKFIMEARNKETLKQKQVTISIFMVTCIILTRRSSGKKKTLEVMLGI